jgi:hypothetical protein
MDSLKEFGPKEISARSKILIQKGQLKKFVRPV